jgi:hypothetical protein
MFGVSMMAQDYDKVRTIPTVDGDESTEFLIVTHATDSSFSSSYFVTNGMFESDDAAVEYTQSGDYLEYQVISYSGGDFAAVLLLSTAADPGYMNVSVYKTETESWSETGTTLDVYNGSWSNYEEYYFPFSVEAGVYYTLRITWYTGVNFNGISVIETEGSTDATLSDLKIDGTTIADFDSATYEYNVLLGANEWINSIEATVNDSNATVEIPEDLTLESGSYSASYTITVTSEANTTQEYTVNVFTPVLVDDGVELAMLSDVYTNSGTKLTDARMNNLNNGDYVEYYVYSDFASNFAINMICANGYTDSESYLNVSTLSVDDSTWTVDETKSVYIPITYDSDGAGSWLEDYANVVSAYFSLEAKEPVLLRVYSVTNKGNSANVYGFSFEEIFTSIDASLKDLTVDGVTVTGFDSSTRSYSVPVSSETTSVSVGAEANDEEAEVTAGLGTVDISGFVTTDTVTVTSETGNTVNYLVNFYTPVEISFADQDSFSINMSDSLFYNNGASVSNTTINWFSDSDYVEYYIYSATDMDLHLIVNAANGNPDTVYTKLNVSTYNYGSEWALDEAGTYYIPHTEEALWTVDYAVDVKYDLSLTANEAVMLRLFAITNATNTVANIYGLTLVNGESGYTAIESVETNELNVWGGTGSLTISCDDAYVGGSVKIYDIMGRLIVNELIESTKEVYNIDQSGFYIVKAISSNNEVTMTKCYVK